MSGGLRRLLLRFVTHDVSTGGSAAYPGLAPLDLPMDPGAAYRRAVAVARDMPRWAIVETDDEGLGFRAEARTPRLGFVDDVQVRVEGRDDDGSRIQVRSTSRVGLYDFGTNARRIRDYLDRLRNAP